MKTHRTSISWLTCDEKGHVYPFPDLSYGAYGEFVPRSKNMCFSYVNAFEESTFDEISNIFSSIFNIKKQMSHEQSDIFQSIYGSTCCDPDKYGDDYIIRSNLKCPYCADEHARDHDLQLDYSKTYAEIPYVTHNYWNSLSDAEKVVRVNKILREQGYIE